MSESPNNLRKIRQTHPDKALRSGNIIAKLMNISPQYYYDLETGRGGRKLNIDHINQLTKIFNVTADEILDNQPTPSESSENKKALTDLAMFLEQAEIMFDGEIYHLDAEDKAKLRTALEFSFWHVKEKNKKN